jgi:2-polyprenyl-3-methyl-5-hydroxy-6-metoxy-1,4-benzoquinol methylase
MTALVQKRKKVWQDGRLVYYARTANEEYWDEIWQDRMTSGFYANYESGCLDELTTGVEKYLHFEDRILEAGCGSGRFIVALLARGFTHVEGIDFGEKTISRLKSLYPQLPVRVGDVLDVKSPDSSYDAYVSIGVVEHRTDGPDPFLKEAFRLLKPGGIAFISVPYVNPLRSLKSRLGYYRKPQEDNEAFYQYAFRPSEFSQILNKAGFEILEKRGVEGLFGVREELHPFFTWLDKVRGGSWFQKKLEGLPCIDSLGHMIMFTCRKPGVSVGESVTS